MNTLTIVAIASIVVIAIVILGVFIALHDMYVGYTKQYDEWFKVMTTGINSVNDCSMLYEIISDDEGKWIKSEIYSIVKHRMEELKC